MTQSEWSQALLNHDDHQIHSTDIDHIPHKQSIKQPINEAINDSFAHYEDSAVNHAVEEDESAQRAKFASELRIGSIRFSWIFLLFIAVIRYGPYFAYDVPGALFIEFQAWFNQPNESPVYTASSEAFMYGIYSWPNVVLPFVSGILIDRVIGSRWSSALFASIIVLGQIIFSIGILQRNLILSYVGRCIFGVGGESVTISQKTLVVRWFDGTALALAFGLVQSFARLGTATAFLLSPIIAENQSLATALIVAIAVCVLSWVCCVLAGFGDKIGQTAMDRAAEAAVDRYSINQRSAEQEAPTPFTIPFRLSDLKLLGLNTWLLTLIIATMSVSASTFQTVAQDLYVNTGAMLSPESADRAISTIAFTAILTCPLFGAVIDRFGRTLSFVLASAVIIFLAHLAILAQVCQLGMFVSIGPYPIMIMVGTAFSITNTAVWPALSHSIEDSRVLATAFGLGTAVQNAALAGFPQLIAALRARCSTTQQEYIVLMLVFLSCSGFAVYFSLWIMWNDREHGGKLNARKLHRPSETKVKELDVTTHGEAEDAI